MVPLHFASTMASYTQQVQLGKLGSAQLDAVQGVLWKKHTQPAIRCHEGP